MRWFHYISAFLLLVIALMIGYLSFSIENSMEKIRTNVIQIFLREAHHLSLGVERWIDEKVPTDLFKTLKSDPRLRDEMQKALSILITPTYRYVYVLRRDENGKYRFLLDGSVGEKAFFDEPLQVKKKIWDRAYETRKCQVIVQSNMQEIAVTHLMPIVRHGRVAGIVAIDFSPKIHRSVIEAIEPIHKMALFVFYAIILLVLIIALEAAYLYWSMKQRFVDSLTHLFNRTYLREFVATHDLGEYSVLMLDIDHFKRINDTYGHKAGDAILQEVARELQLGLREKDVIVRFGGEEFLIFIYRDDLSKQQILAIAERLRERMSRLSILYEGHEIGLSVSIGFVSNPHRYRQFTEAIKEADKLLYVAKRTGRNKVVSDEDDVEKLDDQLGIDEVRRAIDEDRIFCHFQPIFNVEDGSVVEYEALVRLKGSDDTIIPPIRFLPSIERTTTYAAMTKRVLEKVFIEIQTKNIAISVNLNSSDIIDTSIFEVVISTIERSSHFAKFLIIELLENEPYHPETMQDRLKVLKKLGVRLAIDDFGSGYANFDLIAQVAFDIVKIDGSLIQPITTDATKESIVKAIVTMARDLDLWVVAEFVENKEIFEKVKAMGIDGAQGYFLSKPLLEI